MNQKNRIFIFGDLHTKLDIFHRIQEVAKDAKYNIFLGDYCDDWGAYPFESVALLEEMLKWKNTTRHNKRIIFLLGNHDLSEWKSNEFACSGHNYFTHLQVRDIFEQNRSQFQLSYSIGNFIFTHAGLTSKWVYQNIPVDELDSASSISNYLNINFQKNNPDLLKALTQVGQHRGGNDIPSPLWADKAELIQDPLAGINQIVGHTPNPSCETIIDNQINTSLTFCDTFSTTYFNDNLGDQTYLEIAPDHKLKVHKL